MITEDVSWNPDEQRAKRDVAMKKAPELTDDQVKKLIDASDKAFKAVAQMPMGQMPMVTFQERVLPLDHPSVHKPDLCKGERCAIHNPSKHALSHWPRVILAGRTWRVCQHGRRHPDPDDVVYWLSKGQAASALSEHSCCGCCPYQK
jgi:hypothetical protein